MKAYIFTLITAASLTTATSYAQTGVGIGTTTPAASAALDITANNRGLLLPRLTTTEIASIPSPQEGLLVYNKSKYQFWGYQRYDSVVAQQPAVVTSFPLTMNGPVVGQSFTVPVSALLTGVQLDFVNHSSLINQGVRVDLFSGVGFGGTLLGTDTVFLPISNASARQLFSFPETATSPGGVFSIRIECYTCGQSPHHASVAMDASPNSTDQYPGGHRLNAAGGVVSGLPTDLSFYARGLVIGWRPLAIIQSE